MSFASQPSSNELIELAVVGAHLSGMPLNGELTALGATFARSVATRPSYRLFALAGTLPMKPGLLRIEEGAGHSIEVEVWQLDAAAFGHFVSRIPAPLGIGTLALTDGSAPKGFLVEAAGIVDARDISAFGGWRAFQRSLASAA